MKSVAEILKVRTGEERMAALLIGLMLATAAGTGMGGSGIDALFFARFGVQYLPRMYVLLGAVTLVTMLATAALLGRIDQRRLYITLPIILALALVGERAVLSFNLPWFYPVMWLAKGVINAFQGLFTWGLAGAACDVRQAKRLFPLFGAGAILGTVIGSSLTPVVVSLIHTENLILIWAGALAGAFGCGWLLVGRRRAPGSAQSKPRSKSPGLIYEMRQGFDFVRRSSLLTMISISALLFSIAWFSLEFPFNRAATAAYPNEDALAGFLGIFMGVNTAAALLVSLFLANWLFARFGVMPMIIAFPAIYVVGFAVLSVSAPFPAIAAFRFAQIGWAQGVAGTAWQAMYNVIPKQRRDQVRAFTGSVPEQAGVISAGLLLIAAQQVLQPQQIYLIGLATAAIILAVLWRASAAYRAALVDALRAGQPQVFYSEEEPFGGFARDAQAIALLIKGVSDPDPLMRRVSLEILGNLSAPQAGEALLGALSDADAAVRVSALRALACAGNDGVILKAAGCLNDPEPAVRLEAIEALRQANKLPAEMISKLRVLIKDAAPPVRAQAALALAQKTTDRAAIEQLAALTNDPDPQGRTSALAALGMSGKSEHFEIISRAMHDPEADVRRAAARALGGIAHPRSVERLVLALGDDDLLVRDTAVQTLGKIGAPALEPVVAALHIPALEEAALAALALLPYETQAQKIRAYALERASDALRYHQAWRKVPESGARAGLLSESLLHKAQDHALCSLTAISLIGGNQSEMALAIENLHSANPDQRTNALETLEVTDSQAEVIRPLLKLWEPKEPASTGSLDYVLHVMQDEDTWLRACGALAAGEIDHWEIKAALETLASNDRDPLVRETADAALTGLYRGAGTTGLSTMERIMFLRQVPLFAGLPLAELKPIAQIAEEHTYPQGALICRQGEPGDRVHVITSGEVQVVVRQNGGEAVEVARRGPGDTVGEMSIITQEPRTASLVADGEVKSLAIERAAFEKLLRERAEISLAVMRVLCARLKEKS